MSLIKAATSKEFSVRSEIDMALERQFSLPHWTPAQGALLVSGVLPPPGCQKIPKEAISLIDPTTLATPRQLSDAKKILDELRDGWGEKEETKKYLTQNANIEIMDFLCDCYELCQECPGFQPGFYKYFYSYCGWSDGPSSIPFATREMVRHGALLDEAYEFVEKKKSDDEDLDDALHLEEISAIAKLIRRGGKAAYKEALAEAVKESRSISPVSVWAELVKIAEKNKFGLMKTPEGVVKYWRINNFLPLTSEIIEPVLRRFANKIMDKSRNEPEGSSAES